MVACGGARPLRADDWYMPFSIVQSTLRNGRIVPDPYASIILEYDCGIYARACSRVKEFPMENMLGALTSSPCRAGE